MCRHLAYLGDPVTLADLLLSPRHSLKRQSWSPADMRGSGTINADGFGVGWYPAGNPSPARYRRALPIWGDVAFASMAHAVSSTAVVAAVRSATPGMPVMETACAPFTDGKWLFSHNGAVQGWPEAVTEVAAQLPVLDLITLDAPTDSALLWALVRHRLRAGASPAEAVANTVTDVAAAVPTARLNLLLTDGEKTIANTWGHSLWTRPGTVSSEPYDDSEDWEPVADRRLVTMTRSATIVEAL